jgi:hypothetical protein
MSQIIPQIISTKRLLLFIVLVLRVHGQTVDLVQRFCDVMVSIAIDFNRTTVVEFVFRHEQSIKNNKKHTNPNNSKTI